MIMPKILIQINSARNKNVAVLNYFNWIKRFNGYFEFFTFEVNNKVLTIFTFWN
jgi:hypothetical protein